MARKSRKPESAAATLAEIQSIADRVGEWVSRNPAIFLGTALGVLVLAGGYGLFASVSDRAADRASAALSAVERDFREAMGAGPDEFEIPEPANPETARQTRTRFLEEFRRVAEEQAGTLAGALAWLEVGSLQETLGERETAIQTWEAAVGALGRNAVPRALILARIAAAHEEEGRWIEAAEAFERAAAVKDYPSRYSALTDAARCFSEAGADERALAAFDRVENEAADLRIPDHVRSRLSELRARLGSS